MTKIGISKVFESFQGEGYLSGEYMLFVRTSGCSVGCAQCDTDYRFRRLLDLDRLEERLRSFQGKYLWVTGGEPSDWPDIDAIATLAHSHKILPIMATSGIREVRSIWQTYCSPHRPRQLCRRQHEQINLVPGLNGLTRDECVWYLENWLYKYAYLTPMHGDGESLQVCKDLAKSYVSRGCRLGHQSHKIWNVE
jgi:organic radical activating enzyme